MKILAIDPGFERVGLAIIEKGENNKHNLLFSCCFKTSKNLSFEERLFLIGKKIKEIIKKYKPESLAIEKLFLNINFKTFMGVAEARGVIIFCAKESGLSVYEYTPLQIKIAVTGYGRASKEMVTNMVRKLIKINSSSNSDDEMDAIAIGLTFLAYQKKIT